MRGDGHGRGAELGKCGEFGGKWRKNGGGLEEPECRFLIGRAHIGEVVQSMFGEGFLVKSE